MKLFGESNGSVDVLEVAFILLQGFDPSGGFILAHAAFLGGNVAQGLVDVLGHAGGVSADVEDGTVLQPFPKFASALGHLVLDVDFLGLIARPGKIEFVNRAVFPTGLPFLAIEVIGGGGTVTEEQPVFSLCPGGPSFLHEGPEGSDPGPRTDHDDRSVGAFGQLEILVRMEVAGNALPHPLGQVGRANAFALAAVTLVAHDGNRQMNFVGVSPQTRSDRIEAGRHGAEKAGKSLSLDSGLGKLEEEIDQFATPHVIDEAFLVLDLEKILELFGLGEFVEFLDLDLAQDRTGQAVGKGVFESMGLLAEGNAFLPRKADCLQEIGYDLGTVDGKHPEGIPRFVSDPALLERQFEMARLLVRTFRHQVIDEEFGGVGVILGGSVGQMGHGKIEKMRLLLAKFSRIVQAK